MIGAYIRALSFASRRNRFLGSVNEMSANELYRMTHGDDVARPALIVETVVGHGSAISPRLLLGVLFVAAGLGRLYVERRRGRDA